MQTDIAGGPTATGGGRRDDATLVGAALLSSLRDIIENTCTRTDHYTGPAKPIVGSIYHAHVLSRDVLSRRKTRATRATRVAARLLSALIIDTENRYARIFTMFSRGTAARFIAHHVRISIGQYT